MRVKVGDTWYDGEEQPVCVQLTEAERHQVATYECTGVTEGKFAHFPDNWGDAAARREWMRG